MKPNEDIIRIAREAGVVPVNHYYVTDVFLERFHDIAIAAEREACAKLLDEMAERDKLSNYYAVAARAIRAREQA